MFKQLETKNWIINFFEEESNKPKILFSHGFGANAKTIFSLNTQDRNYSIVSVDYPGLGKTKSKFHHEEVELKDYQTFLIEFLEAYSEKIDLIVAHSLGTLGALSALDKKLTKKVVLFSPYNYYLDTDTDLELIKHYLIPSDFETAANSLRDLSVKNDDAYEKSVKYFAKLAVEVYPIKYKVMGDFVEKMFQHDYLNNVVKPLYLNNASNIVIVSGVEDKYTKMEVLEKISSETNIPLTKIKNAGHAIFFDQPYQTNKVIVKEIKKLTES
ncbi:pimeloyl-ACP methyl ester carboxylesterase [Mycoplasma testudineum]|uniref:Pimeloyl-ACP methyl ester carboxylesterase n=1 Tax=Mycoplasma testudineum TaxID=244584 RepID=A0A4R6I9T7_9MOLU|nr:alpha/beta hydrolase [Mycoplasma testudineum]OYD26483.1 hypothetical protein CG473_03800 [Mycoplasma testudineum]TDO18953.1 pimeloyl-ACP methyl ester carboxylesterase [Mycoplasma testudineum]